MIGRSETSAVHQLCGGFSAQATSEEVALDAATLATNLIFGFGSVSESLYPFFMIRALLLKHMKACSQRVFAITSVEPGDGKTHVAVNLAAALSRIHPTVLLELDLRKPSVEQRLGLGLGPAISGIDDYLDGATQWLDTSVKISGFHLTVHRVRQPRSNAEALLGSSRLTDALDLIRRADQQPICIIDTPPALLNDDLALIAQQVDGVVLVVQEGRTRKRGLLDVVKVLDSRPVIGSILNMSISQPPYSAGYGYGARGEN